MSCNHTEQAPRVVEAPIVINRRWPEEGFTRIPAWVYTDPAVYKKEMEVFFAGDTWNYVGLECEVPEVGSFKRQWIGDRPVVMVRNEDGEINVIENRCAHKGAQICWENTGKVTDFTCPYHQWNYDLNGNLQGVPFRRGALGKGGMPKDFDPKKWGIKRLRTVNRGGSIWATFSETAPSFEEYCGPDVLAEIDHMLPGKKLTLLGYSRQLIPSNWKMYLENLKDPYHATLLHTFYITFGLWRADSKSECIPTGGGAHSVMVSHNEGKKKTEATAEMERFRDDLRILDAETVTPRKEFNRGRV
ncbi:TPA: Rieske 2Fe-2S domain-containing protein, partial [Escherichia coli]|nr:Rieske 2Fe-2S domain-containing protein [Escherichia coli]